MASQATANTPNEPEERSYYRILKEGGYRNFQHFMHSHELKMHDNDDIQMGKEILRRYEENDRAHADDRGHARNKSPENDKPTETNINPHDSDSDSDPPSGVRLGYCAPGDDDDDNSDEEGCRLDAPYNHFEWGLDEPDLEGYPAFSDDEAAFGQDGDDDEVNDDDDGGNGYEEDW
ncbi:uncharacterized protein DSM5745_06657 [Aspergillus mulundensis]|uniref:Uncharacterized protein n=1 Tax=Aspergillus mulundensis TaxID=1810919 RepID=A0A3D8RRN5_9EURO|nr:hypothetical protein DSM5745_06657 [Aspergillus mulundensis]RDW76665.1 hypothetical protein DSM5745_06657 [Aspergillus mulundensis]